MYDEKIFLLAFIVVCKAFEAESKKMQRQEIF